MWIDNQLTIRFAKRLHVASTSDNAIAWAVSFEGESLRLPSNFSPDIELLEIHREHISG
jgi:hypothetical protein